MRAPRAWPARVIRDRSRRWRPARVVLHASCVELSGTGVVLLGPPGSGKSDLALRLIDGGARLVSDDRLAVERQGDVLIGRPRSHRRSDRGARSGDHAHGPLRIEPAGLVVAWRRRAAAAAAGAHDLRAARRRAALRRARPAYPLRLRQDQAGAYGAAGRVKPRMGQIVLVTGMSGAGRTTALQGLGGSRLRGRRQSAGHAAWQPGAAGRPAGSRPRHRHRLPHARLQPGRSAQADRRPAERVGAQAAAPVPGLRGRDPAPRFNETRRRHPLALDRPVTDGIAHERRVMAGLREQADLVIDTSQLAAGDLRRLIGGYFEGAQERRLTLSVLSFAYRGGLPREADIVFDVRFLANPHYVDELRPLHGATRGAGVRGSGSVLSAAPGAPRSPAVSLLPSYQREGRSYLTIASAAPAGGTARSWSPRRSPGVCASWAGRSSSDIATRRTPVPRSTARRRSFRRGS